QKLLQAHYADAVPLHRLKSEQKRISQDLATAERRLASTTAAFEEAERTLFRAIELAGRLQEAYRIAPDHVRRMFNQAVFEKLYVTEAGVVRADLTEAFDELLAHDFVERLEAQHAAHTAQRLLQAGGGRPYKRT